MTIPQNHYLTNTSTAGNVLDQPEDGGGGADYVGGGGDDGSEAMAAGHRSDIQYIVLFITVDNDNTTKSITLVVIRHALLMVMMATDLDSILSFVVYSWTAD